jgi:uncharacterized protein
MYVNNLLIKPSSYNCNIDCSYCFYKRVEEVYPNKRAMMTLDTAQVLIEKTLALGLSRNSYCWQGGEPTLLGLDFYKEIVRMQKRNILPGQVVENSLQTNGLLLDEEWCAFLRENNFLVGLSLDGPEEFHDRYRIFSNGSGTFDRVMERIELLKEHKVDFNILTLLTDVNIHSPERIYSFLRDNDLNYLQFIPCIERDPQSGDLLPFSINGRELGEFYCTLFDLWMEDGFPYVSIRLFEDILIYYVDGVHTSCGWLKECGSYLLVEHNGDCYPCDFFVYPKWKLGNITEESFESIMRNPLRAEFGRMKSRINSECNDCRWLDFCNGDCTKFRFSADGRFSRISELCVTWKMLLEHIEPNLENIIERAKRIRSALRQNILENTRRNDPCPCGSGKKFKRCCGRGLGDVKVG